MFACVWWVVYSHWRSIRCGATVACRRGTLARSAARLAVISGRCGRCTGGRWSGACYKAMEYFCILKNVVACVSWNVRRSVVSGTIVGDTGAGFFRKTYRVEIRLISTSVATRKLIKRTWRNQFNWAISIHNFGTYFMSKMRGLLSKIFVVQFRLCVCVSRVPGWVCRDCAQKEWSIKIIDKQIHKKGRIPNACNQIQFRFCITAQKLGTLFEAYTYFARKT